MYHYVTLDNKHNEFCVDEEAYEQIVAITQAHKLCLSDYRNRHPYSEENPCVGRNICLEHLLAKQPHLSALDSLASLETGNTVYRFVDTQGFVWTTVADSSDEAQKNLTESMNYYGFTPPVTVSARGKSVDFHSYYASLYGDLHGSVIVLSYNHTGERVKGVFLLYKNGGTKELQKRSELYTRAESLVEANKVNGEYHVDGTVFYHRSEAAVYTVVAQLESAMYDVTLRLQNGKEAHNAGA